LLRCVGAFFKYRSGHVFGFDIFGKARSRSALWIECPLWVKKRTSELHRSYVRFVPEADVFNTSTDVR